MRTIPKLALSLALFLSCGTKSLFAQPSDSIDTGHCIVAYDHTIRTTDAAGNPVEEVCRLAAIRGNHVTYQGEYYRTLMEMAGDKSTETQLAEFAARAKNLPVILIGYPEGRMTAIDKIIPQRYTVDGELPRIDWQIAEDTMTLSGFPCQKAMGDYAGRTWVCWYRTHILSQQTPTTLTGQNWSGQVSAQVSPLSWTELDYTCHVGRNTSRHSDVRRGTWNIQHAATLTLRPSARLSFSTAHSSRATSEWPTRPTATSRCSMRERDTSAGDTC